MSNNPPKKKEEEEEEYNVTWYNETRGGLQHYTQNYGL